MVEVDVITVVACVGYGASVKLGWLGGAWSVLLSAFDQLLRGARCLVA